MKLGLDIRRQLVVTPQLRQGINMLQMNSTQLDTYINHVIANNALLETDVQDISLGSDLGTEASGGEGDGPLIDDAGLYDNFADDSMSSMSSRTALISDSGDKNGGSADPSDTLNRIPNQAQSIYQHVNNQLPMLLSDPQDHLIAHALIAHLDINGWLRADIATVAQQLGAEIEKVEQVLKNLQHIDPAGLFARDLRECLTLQAIDRKIYTDDMAGLLDNLTDMARYDFDVLAKKLNIPYHQLKKLIHQLRSLNPHPGGVFDQTPHVARKPDVMVSLRSDRLTITLDRVHDYSVRVNRYLYRQARRSCSEDQMALLTSQYSEASFLERALRQRRNTMIAIMEAVVVRQEQFFRQGLTRLIPMVLADIAQDTGLHESTVSRVIANKILACPQGTFALKSLFSARLKAVPTASARRFFDDSSPTAALAAKDKLATLVNSEKKDHIFSDQELVILLRKEGYNVARRTVAKYREVLGISSSIVRRRRRNALL